ncbi:unnamed protein product, partial [Mesorhabditis spiculigera]
MWLRSYSTSLYLFLYAPIALIVLFSFNAGRSGLAFECCSVQWFGRAFGNPFIMEALGHSAFIATCSALIATLFGTLAVFGLQRAGARVRLLFDALTYCAIIVPGIVIGISTLIAFISLFDVINPLLASWMPSVPRLNMGFFTVIAAHSLFTMALVMVIVRSRVDTLDKALLEASADLYAPPMQTFWRVTLPQISPAIMAGFLLAFTFSFDDFIIAFFVAGSETTLPIYIFSSIRRGVTPEINAVSTVIICLSLALLSLTMRDQLYINGEWVSPDLGGYLDVIDPATEQAFARVAASTEEDIDHAVRAARRAFDNGWSQTSGAERGQWLDALADELEHAQPALAELEVRDNGKPLPEAQWDVGDAIGCFRYYAGLARELDQRQDQPLALPDARFRCRIRHEAIGVAGQIIPWNYPLLMATWKVAPALAAGATVVLKPSELTPLTALELAAAADRIGLPAGVLNVVTGLGQDAGSP